MNVVLHLAGGPPRPLDVAGWSAPATKGEQRLVRDLAGPVLDLGCGPGRLVRALADLGVPALGVDASPVAVRAAHDRRAPALLRSVFDRLPAEGRWPTVLLLDGNIGIGGDPASLLRRVRSLLAPRGVALVEVDGPGRPTARTAARLQRADRRTGWFPWALVAVDGLDDVVASAGLRRTCWRCFDDRWIAVLEKAE